MDDLLNQPYNQAIALSVLGLIGGLIPFIVAIVCTAVWWKKLVHPGFFLVMAILATCGLQGLFRSGFYMMRTLTTLAAARWMDGFDAPGAFVWMELSLTAVAGVLTMVVGALLLRTAMRMQLPASAP